MRIASAIAVLGILLASTITLQASPVSDECKSGDFGKRFWCEHHLNRG